MVRKSIEILDRDREWALLEDIWERRRPDLAFVVGLRRVGKSFVLARFVREVAGVYFQATRSTERDQLVALSRAMGQHFDDAALQSGLEFSTWERAFEYLTKRIEAEPFVFVIDEFPYLTEAAPALPSIIQKFWDHEWQNTRIKLVLSGSYVSAMTQLEQGDQPLFGRRTARLTFSPFSYREAALFTPDYPTKDKMIAHGTFGRLPGNLALLDPDKPVAQNISDIILEPSGRLSDDAQHLLDAFLGESSVYYAVVEAVATGDHTWSGITSRVGRTGGSLSRPLQWLEEMGLLERVAPITETKPARSKRAQYRVGDPYIRFWHRIVSPLVSRGSLGLVEPDRLFNEQVGPRIDDFMGPVFEGICRDFARRGDALPFAPLQVGEWWDASSTHPVDLVALGEKGELLVAECKWGRVGRQDMDLLHQRASMVASELDAQPPNVYLAAFSALGKFDPSVKKAADAGEILLFTGDDLFPRR